MATETATTGARYAFEHLQEADRAGELRGRLQGAATGLASAVNLAHLQLDAALPSIRAGAEALGDTDEARTMWMVSYLLEQLHDKLVEAEVQYETGA